MTFDKNYYVDEYKRVMDNLKVNEERAALLAENVEAKALKAKDEKRKQLLVTSAAVLVSGVGLGLLVLKRKKR